MEFRDVDFYWASLELLDQCSELIEEFREYDFNWFLLK